MVLKCQIAITTKKENILPSQDGSIDITSSNGEHNLMIFIPPRQHYELHCKDCKPLLRPRQLCAKSLSIDVRNHDKLESLKLTFSETTQLSNAFDELVKYITEAEPKKASSILSHPEKRPQYKNPNSKSAASVPSSPVSNLGTLTTKSTSQPRPSLGNRAGPSLPATSTWGGPQSNRALQSVVESPKSSRNIGTNYSPSSSSPSSRKRTIKEDLGGDWTEDNHGKSEFSSFGNVSESKKIRMLPIDYNSHDQHSPELSSDINDKENDVAFAPSHSSMSGIEESTNYQWNEAKTQSITSPSLWTHRGLWNLGNSCYMNSSLQALASLPIFITQLLKSVPPEEALKVDKHPVRSKLLQAVMKVYNHMFAVSQDKNEVGRRLPRDFLRDVRDAAGAQIERSMGDPVQHDAQEFMSRLLDIIHDEIDGKLPVRSSSNKENECYDAMNTSGLSEPNEDTEKQKEDSDHPLPALHGLKITKPKGFTNPGKLFEVVCYNRLVCNKCGHQSKNEDNAREVPVGICDDANTIHKLLIKQFERHPIAWKCPNCKLDCASMSTSFHKLPECLIIVLKRYGYDNYGGTKSSKRIRADPHLHLQMLCEGSQLKNEELAPCEVADDLCIEEEASHVTPASGHNTPIKPSSLSQTAPDSFPKGFRSPCKSAQRSLFSQENNDDPGSQTDIFDDAENECSLNMESKHIKTRDTTPEPTKEIHSLSSEDVVSNELVRVIDTDAFDSVARLKLSGGAWIDANANPLNNSRPPKLSIQTHDSDTQIIDIKKNYTTVLWNPLSAQKIHECRETLDSSLSTQTIAEIKSWRDAAFGGKREIMQKMNKFDIERRPVDGDGACLFRSFAWWLYGTEEHHDIIRNAICDFIQDFENEFEQLTGPEWNGYGTAENYLKFKRGSSEWGSELEIWAMATYLCCTIFSHHEGFWKAFNPRFLWFSDGKQRLKNDGNVPSTLEETGAIYIINDTEAHFDPVCNVKCSVPYSSNSESNQGYEQYKQMEIREASPELGDCTTPPALISDHEDNNLPEEAFGSYTYNPDDDGTVFTLSAVVNHHGATLNHGHYTAFSFDPDRNVWLSCDDSSVTVVSEKDVLEKSVESGYLFVYRRRHEGDEKQFSVIN